MQTPDLAMKIHFTTFLPIFIAIIAPCKGKDEDHVEQVKLSISLGELPDIPLLKHYELVSVTILHDKEHYQKQKKLSNDANSGKAPLCITFTVYGSSYRIKLYPIEYDQDASFPSVISRNLQLLKISQNGTEKLHFSDIQLDLQYFKGYAEGYSHSDAHGWVRNGTFTGGVHIYDNNTVRNIFIEPASRFFKDQGEKYQNTSVVYRDKDIQIKPAVRTAAAVTKTKAEDSQQSSVPPKIPSRKRYTGLLDFYANIKNNMGKREKDEGVRRICSLHAVVDHTFYQNIGQSDVTALVDEVIFYTVEADLIYRNTDFDGDGQSDGVGLLLEFLSIYDSEDSVGYNLGQDFADADTFLDIFSQFDFSHVCLGAAFVYRDFDNSVVGLAWLGDFNSYLGGVCSPRAVLNGQPTSLNTLMVSALNNGHVLPPIVNAITLTHEIGHSLGSEHDPTGTPDRSCSPGGSDGYYIMHPSNSEYNKPNNKKFSNCSKAAIIQLLAMRSQCFKVNYEPFCGNGITEAEEECDCGTIEVCGDLDKCCIPPNSTTGSPCTINRTNGKTCSPRESACCSDSCDVSQVLKVCRQKECIMEAYCSGTSSDCPPSPSLPDGAVCRENTGVCYRGLCTYNICEVYGHTTCTCIHQPCLRCCQQQNTNICQSLKDMNLGASQSVWYAPEGTTCLNSTGYCDHNHYCITQNGFFDIVIYWLKTHWHYITIGVLGASCCSLAAYYLRLRVRLCT